MADFDVTAIITVLASTGVLTALITLAGHGLGVRNGSSCRFAG